MTGRSEARLFTGEMALKNPPAVLDKADVIGSISYLGQTCKIFPPTNLLNISLWSETKNEYRALGSFITFINLYCFELH